MNGKGWGDDEKSAGGDDEPEPRRERKPKVHFPEDGHLKVLAIRGMEKEVAAMAGMHSNNLNKSNNDASYRPRIVQKLSANPDALTDFVQQGGTLANNFTYDVMVTKVEDRDPMLSTKLADAVNAARQKTEFREFGQHNLRSDGTISQKPKRALVYIGKELNAVKPTDLQRYMLAVIDKIGTDHSLLIETGHATGKTMIGLITAYELAEKRFNERLTGYNEYRREEALRSGKNFKPKDNLPKSWARDFIQPTVIILVPTRALAKEYKDHLDKIKEIGIEGKNGKTRVCKMKVFCDIGQGMFHERDCYDIVVTTAGRLKTALEKDTMHLDCVDRLIVDSPNFTIPPTFQLYQKAREEIIEKDESDQNWAHMVMVIHIIQKRMAEGADVSADIPFLLLSPPLSNRHTVAIKAALLESGTRQVVHMKHGDAATTSSVDVSVRIVKEEDIKAVDPLSIAVQSECEKKGITDPTFKQFILHIWQAKKDYHQRVHDGEKLEHPKFLVVFRDHATCDNFEGVLRQMFLLHKYDINFVSVTHGGTPEALAQAAREQFNQFASESDIPPKWIVIATITAAISQTWRCQPELLVGANVCSGFETSSKGIGRIETVVGLMSRTGAANHKGKMFMVIDTDDKAGKNMLYDICDVMGPEFLANSQWMLDLAEARDAEEKKKVENRKFFQAKDWKVIEEGEKKPEDEQKTKGAGW